MRLLCLLLTVFFTPLYFCTPLVSGKDATVSGSEKDATVEALVDLLTDG